MFLLRILCPTIPTYLASFVESMQKESLPSKWPHLDHCLRLERPARAEAMNPAQDSPSRQKPLLPNLGPCRSFHRLCEGLQAFRWGEIPLLALILALIIYLKSSHTPSKTRCKARSFGSAVVQLGLRPLLGRLQLALVCLRGWQHSRPDSRVRSESSKWETIDSSYRFGAL